MTCTHWRRLGVALGMFLCSCSKVAAPAGPIVADVLSKSGFISHTSIMPPKRVGSVQRLDNSVVTLKFDNRTILLDSPLRHLAMGYGLAKDASVIGFTCDVHIIGSSMDLSHHVHSTDEWIPSPQSQEASITIGTWDQTFAEPIREVSVTNVEKMNFRMDFSVDTGAGSLLFFPNKYGMGNLHKSIEAFPNTEKELLAALEAGGYSRSEVQNALSELKGEYRLMTDRDFMLKSLASNGPSLRKESDLKSALRYLYLQGNLAFEWAFLTQINGQEVFVFKQKATSRRELFPFRVYCSFVDAHGAETAWAGMLLPAPIDQQKVADRFATLLTDDQNK